MILSPGVAVVAVVIAAVVGGGAVFVGAISLVVVVAMLDGVRFVVKILLRQI